MAAAQAAVRKDPNKGTKPITVIFGSGTYYVGKTVVFTSADSGTQAAPVTYTGCGATATLSGGVPLNNLTWTSYKNGIMQAAVPSSTFANYSFDDGKAAAAVSGGPGSSGKTYGFSSVLFLNGQRQHMARYPNYKSPTSAYGGNAGRRVVTEQRLVAQTVRGAAGLLARRAQLAMGQRGLHPHGRCPARAALQRPSVGVVQRADGRERLR